jgi:hypothetical protein
VPWLKRLVAGLSPRRDQLHYRHLSLSSVISSFKVGKMVVRNLDILLVVSSQCSVFFLFASGVHVWVDETCLRSPCVGRWNQQVSWIICISSSHFPFSVTPVKISKVKLPHCTLNINILFQLNCNVSSSTFSHCTTLLHDLPCTALSQTDIMRKLKFNDISGADMPTQVGAENCSLNPFSALGFHDSELKQCFANCCLR